MSNVSNTNKTKFSKFIYKVNLTFFYKGKILYNCHLIWPYLFAFRKTETKEWLYTTKFHYVPSRICIPELCAKLSDLWEWVLLGIWGTLYNLHKKPINKKLMSMHFEVEKIRFIINLNMYINLITKQRLYLLFISIPQDL